MKRSELKEHISNCINGTLSLKQLNDIARKDYSAEEYDADDWYGEEELSLSLEITNQLESADMNLVIVEDLPFYNELLESSVDETRSAIDEFYRYVEGIDYHKRSRNLRGDPFYERYLSDPERLG